MSGLIEKLNLQEVMNGIELKTKSDNLEDIYSELHSRPECIHATEELERRLYNYFEILELPDEPIMTFLFLVLGIRFAFFGLPALCGALFYFSFALRILFISRSAFWPREPCGPWAKKLFY